MPNGTEPPPEPVGPPIKVTVTDVADSEVDYRKQGELQALGSKDSGWIERLAAALWTALIRLLDPLIELAARAADKLLSAIAHFIDKAEAESSPEFYELLAAVIEDLTGVHVDGAQLFQEFQRRGRVGSMQNVGKQIFDLLASEFAGVPQQQGPGGFETPAGAGIGGLPATQLTPEQGLAAARAFLGFAMSWAIREGNQAMLAGLIPFGLGEHFRDYGTDLARNIGLGRLTRIVFRPLFQAMVATPAEWAMNKQYRPKLLAPGDAWRGFNAGFLDGPQLLEEFARQGYDETRRGVVQLLNTRMPNELQLFILELTGQMQRGEREIWLKRMGYTEETAGLVLKAQEKDFIRRLSFELAHRLLALVLSGAIDADTYKSIIDRFTFTESEKTALVGMVSELLSHPTRRITLAQMESAFKQGVVTVVELEQYLQTRGYPEDDRGILLQLALLDLAKVEEAAKVKAAREAAKKPTTGGSAGTPTG